MTTVCGKNKKNNVRNFACACKPVRVRACVWCTCKQKKHMDVHVRSCIERERERGREREGGREGEREREAAIAVIRLPFIGRRHLGEAPHQC